MPRLSHRARTRARALRRDDNPVEALLWARLRARRCAGLRFRRQHPLPPFTLDFYCPAARLCVEVDGTDHVLGQQPGRDAGRDDWLASKGIVTLRFWSTQILGELDGVCEEIARVGRARLG